MRLIDADAIRMKAVPHTRGEYGYSANIRKWAVLVGDIDDAPTIDPESLRPQGEWVLGVVEPGYFTPGGNRPWICSECGKVISWMLDKPRENYCPNCGAKMKGGTA